MYVCHDFNMIYNKFLCIVVALNIRFLFLDLLDLTDNDEFQWSRHANSATDDVKSNITRHSINKRQTIVDGQLQVNFNTFFSPIIIKNYKL